MRWSTVLAALTGEPLTDTMLRRSGGNFFWRSRRVTVIFWQCGHHVAKISSKYGLPAKLSDESVPPFAVTEKDGACEPTFTGGGREGNATGLTAAPLTCAFRAITA